MRECRRDDADNLCDWWEKDGKYFQLLLATMVAWILIANYSPLTRFVSAI